MMGPMQIDVLIVGTLAGHDVILAEHLSRKGLRCCVMRRVERNSIEVQRVDSLGSYHTHFSPNAVTWYRHCGDFLRVARRSRLIISFTGALIGALGKLWPFRRILGLPPVVNFTTGSDITELAAESSVSGARYRRYLRYAKLNWCTWYPHALKNILALRLPNVVFLRYPYYLASTQEMDEISEPRAGRIRFLHPSHLDWKVNDPGAHRNSSKGNDRFLRAMARALKEGLDAECIILDRGPDRDLAKELLCHLGVADRFVWKSHLNRQELFREYIDADVVVDQFDCGGLGGIAVEAMSLGRPVLVYLHDPCLRVLYPEAPPVLNCCTENEIYEQICKCKDRAELERIGRCARGWVWRYHHWETCLDQFLVYYTLLTGHQVVDYGWGRDPYSLASL